MADRLGAAILWAGVGLWVLLLALSITGDGTWMGGMPMGWMMAGGLLVGGFVVYGAYRLGRMEQQVEDLKRKP